MYSGMIGKVAKARAYAVERDRFEITRLEVTVRGDNAQHHVRLEDAGWICGCDFFAHNATCAHTMALETLLEDMIPREVRYHSAA